MRRPVPSPRKQWPKSALLARRAGRWGCRRALSAGAAPAMALIAPSRARRRRAAHGPALRATPPAPAAPARNSSTATAACEPDLSTNAIELVIEPARRGCIAQLVEQLTLNQRVAGSSPAAPTNLFKDLGGFPPNI